MRIKSTRTLLLTDYPEPPNPGGLIVPSPIDLYRRVSSRRLAIWDMRPSLAPDTVEVCTVNHITYSGSATLCGFKGFFTYNDGITPRYLTKTVKGFQQYVNGYFYSPLRPTPLNEKARIMNDLKLLVAGDNVWTVADIPPAETPHLRSGYKNVPAIESAWYGQAAYDPTDGCSLANNIHVFRRTNGWQYANVMQFSTGAATSDEIVVSVNNLWAGPYPGEFQTVVGYNEIRYVGLNERHYVAVGNTAYGNQLGSHTVFGYVKELLGNEHTLYDQLVIDGAVVTATKANELVSFDDSTGIFSGSLSAISVVIPETLNEIGFTYKIEFVILRTTGVVSSHQVVKYQYVGNGTNPRQISVPLPVALPGTSIAFSGECVIVAKDFSGWNEFELQPENVWLVRTNPITDWPQEGRFICGNPSLIGVDDFDTLPDTGIGGTILETESGQCWENGRMFQPVDIIGWHEYDSQADGEYNITPGAIGFRGLARFFIYDNYLGTDDFNAITDGTYTQTYGGIGWADLGRFLVIDEPIGYDDFNAITDGTYTTTPQAQGFAGDGRLFIVDTP